MSAAPYLAEKTEIWEQHQRACGRCALVKIDRSCTWGFTCLAGALLLKDVIVASAAELGAERERRVDSSDRRLRAPIRKTMP
jgi:hypothetical protein